MSTASQKGSSPVEKRIRAGRGNGREDGRTGIECSSIDIELVRKDKVIFHAIETGACMDVLRGVGVDEVRHLEKYGSLTWKAKVSD
jgi:hypothetical protein